MNTSSTNGSEHKSSDLILYNYFRSSASYRVRCVLELKELAYEYRAVHLIEGGGEQYRDDFKKLNPMAQVPCLVHKQNAISQSLPIAEYLEEVFPDRFSVLPKDSFSRSKVREFCEIINCTQPMQNLITLNKLRDLYGVQEKDRLTWLSIWFDKAFEALESMAQKSNSTYALGSEPTLADCFLAPQIYASKRMGYSMDRFKHLSRVNDNLMNHPAFKAAHPHVQPDTPGEFRGK